MSWKKVFSAGLIDENPILAQMIGLCPLLAVSTSLANAFGMAVAATFVLVGSNIIVALLRKHIPQSIRIPIFLVIISTFVTITDYAMAAWVPDLHKTLGVFIPLIVVNCIILARAEAFAYKNTVVDSLLDGLGMGAGFMIVICVIGFIRELLGDGRFLGRVVLSEPAVIMILPPGAFITIGALMAIVRALGRKKA